MPSGPLTPGATFQSHNRLCTRTAYGFFFTYVYKASTVSVQQYAALWFSPTGDAPFTLLDAYGVFGGGAPAVLADEYGDVYWLVGDDQTSNLLIRKYFYSNGSGGMDRVQRIYSGYVSTKWSAMYHEHHHCIYIFTFYPAAHNFSIFNQDLSLRDSYQLTKNGSVSGVEYPFLVKDQDLFAAGWVTTPVSATSPFYDGIHYVMNNLGGSLGHWYAPQTGALVSLPVVSDDTGPTPEMRPSFVPAANSVWLDAMTLTNRLNVHMTFASPNGPSPTTQVEQTFHSWGSSWYRIAIHDNLLQGGATSKVAGATLTIQSIRGSSAFYFKGADNALYLGGVSKEKDSAGNNWINILKSIDDGVTWQDFAQSDTTFNVYALNGFREGIQSAGGVANGDEIVGLFTHVASIGAPYPQEVYSFHIPIA